MADNYLGEIRMFGGNFAPVGWALCNGSLLSISENQALFALIGTTYGGDGMTTFALPDLQGRAPIHKASAYPLGQVGGVEEVMLTSQNLAAHTHVAASQSANGTLSSPANAVWAGNSDYNCFAQAAPSAPFNAGSIGHTGGNLPHENMMPFTAMNFIIATQGIFPQQS